MIREFQVRQQLGFINGVHFLNRLVLDDDGLGHKHVDAITDLDFDLAVPYRQGNFTADLDAPATQFVRKARLICRLQQAGPSTTTSAICSISSRVCFISSLLRALRAFAVRKRYSRVVRQGEK